MKKIFISLYVLFLILNITSCAVPQTGLGKAKDSPFKNASDITEFESSQASSQESTSLISSTSSKSASSLGSVPSQAASFPDPSTSSVSSAKSPAPSEIKITDISYSYCRAMFLDSRGNVYLAGRDMFNDNKFNRKANKIFENVKAICAEQESSLYMLSVVDVNNNYLAMGTAPDGTKYSKFTKIMADVKKAGKGLILKRDNSLYIWGVYKDKYERKLDLNAKVPQYFLSDVKEFYGSCTHGYAIKNNGDLYTWGATTYNTIDNYGFIPFKIASDVREVNGFSTVAPKVWFITNNGSSLYNIPAYRGTFSSKDPRPDKDDFPKPVKIADNVKSGWLNINAPAYITNDNTLYMWGNYNTPYYEEIVWDSMETGTPEKVANDVLQVGSWHNNAYLDAKGNLITFGNNNDGRLGIGKDGSYFTKEKHIVLTNIVKMYYGGSIFAINRKGEVYSWGINTFFSGGTGETTEIDWRVLTPKKVLFE